MGWSHPARFDHETTTVPVHSLRFGQAGKTLVDRFKNGDTFDFRIDLNGELLDVKGAASLNDIVSQVNALSNKTTI